MPEDSTLNRGYPRPSIDNDLSSDVVRLREALDQIDVDVEGLQGSVSTGDTGTVTSAMIADGTIVDADINASAEISVSKLKDGSARQLLQTAANGTDVEWTSNIDIPGTLDVTGAVVFDNNLTVQGDLAVTGTPTAPTAATATNTTQLATTAFVKAQAYAPLASPALTGDPTAPTPATGDNDTSIATTAFVQGEFTAKTVTSDTDVTANRLLKNLTGPAQAFRRGNILGTVSQSGGVPTGAVIEQGSNANGQYTKFADGTQICSFVLSLGTRTAVGAGTVDDPYRSANLDWTYPVTYPGGSPVVVGTHTYNTTSGTRKAGSIGMRSVGTGSAREIQVFFLGSSTENFDVFGQMLAIGRWY